MDPGTHPVEQTGAEDHIQPPQAEKVLRLLEN